MTQRAFAPADALALALLAAPPLAVYAPASIAPLGAVAALAIIAVQAINRRLPVLGAPGLLVLLLLASAWGAATAFWSIRPDESLKRAAQIAAIFLAGSVLIGGAEGLAPIQRRRVATAAAMGIALAVALILVERLSGDALRRLIEPGHAFHDGAMKRAATLLVLLLAAPAAFLMRDGKGAAAFLLVLAVGAATALLDSIAARLAFAVAMSVAALAWFLPRTAAVLLAAAFTAWIALAPFVVRLPALPDPTDAASRGAMPDTALHRLMIWRYAAGKIAERPVLGWGLDASRSMPDARQVIPWQMRDAAAKPAGMMTVVQMPLHPHNAPLQWWMELGLPGAALGALAGIAAVAAAMRARNDPAGRAAALGLVAAGMTVAVISYGAWQSWWLFAMYLAAAGMTAATRPA